MRYIYGTTQITQKKNSIVVLGNFDGVHIGHQRLFKIAKEMAQKNNLQVVVLSFYPHPTWVVGNHPKTLLMSRKDKKNKIASMDIDVLIEYPFTKEFANMSAEDFFTDILLEDLQAKALVIGSNYLFGKGKTADASYMEKLGLEYHVEICVVDAVKVNNIEVSSSRIRQLIIDGHMNEAKELLGHPYTVVGTVISGKKIGRTIGFPTINIIPDPDRTHPPNGVYATTVKVRSSIYRGMTNIGYNPTVNGLNKIIETHIFDFNEMIYGEEVEVYFHKFIRKEHRFNSIEELKKQIEIDRVNAEVFLKKFIK